MAVLALTVTAPGLAQAQPSAESLSSPAADGRLPEGWRYTGTGAGKELVWTSPEPVPMGDARIEFYAGHRLLGRPVAAPDRRSFKLAAGAARIGAKDELRVLASGRRLDAAAPPPRKRRSPGLAAPARPATPLPANPVDPGVAGPYRTVDGEYALKSVKLPGLAAPVEMRATVAGPVGAPGKRPLALFLHGRHSTCFGPGGEQGMEWPCKSGTQSVPSYQGYQQAQKLLASQGYVTVSVSANGINGQDERLEDAGAQARSSLVRLHLARWAQWAAKRADAPAAVRATAPADLSRVLLVGHSRGGEGVNRAALDSLYRPPADQDGYGGPVRWTIRGNVLIGPTLFGQNPAPDVPSTTILPGCDGDVSDLQGQIYADGTRGVSNGSALHSSVYMVGANHNFFNTEWTPGQSKAPATDDFWDEDDTDPVCAKTSKSRLTAPQQQTAGATYIAAAARLFVAGDDRVRPLLDGSDRRAPSAAPARVLTHAVGAHRTAAVLPDASLAVDGGRVCAQVDTDPARSCLPPEAGGSSPHFAAWGPSPEPGRDAVAMQWSKAGQPVRVRPARPFSLAGAQALDLRMIVPPNTTGTELDVALVDASGRRASLGPARVDGLPGSDRTASYWAREVRVPLSAATGAGLDLKRVTALELTPRSRTGQAWLMDAWGWRPGTPAARAAALPRVDLGRLTVKEGDSGERTYRIPAHVSGQGSGQVRLFVPKPGTDEVTSQVVTVRPGSHFFDLPVTIQGNTRYGPDIQHDALVKAVRGAVVGSPSGGVTAQNDDPMPKVSVTPVADRVTEGKPLTWRVNLSQAADTDIVGEFALRPVTDGAELSTLDVDPAWLEEYFSQSPTPARPVSDLAKDATLTLAVPAGETSAEVSVPTIADTVREPEEHLKLQWSLYDQNGEPHPGPAVTGTVLDAS